MGSAGEDDAASNMKRELSVEDLFAPLIKVSNELGIRVSDPYCSKPFDHGTSSASSDFKSASDAGLHNQGNSTSDEDQQAMDDRKQRRMLSNRESARRSRLRKQQHLDELRGLVAQLRAQNGQMLSNFNLATQHFTQLSEENRMLRSEAMDLSHQLQRLHHAVVMQRANGLRFGFDSGHAAHGSSGQEISASPPQS